MDIGVWGQTDKYLKDPIEINRDFEAIIKHFHGRKMLYAHQYYTQKEFWLEYNEHWYNQLRAKYQADKVFPDVWIKTYVKERYRMRKWQGGIKVLLETLKGKHINT